MFDMINIPGFAEIEREINRAIPGSIQVQSEGEDGKYYKVRIVVHGLTCYLTCYIGMTYTNGIWINPADETTDKHRVVATIVSKYPYLQRHNLVALIRWLYAEVMSESYNTLLNRCIELYPGMKQCVETDPVLYLTYNINPDAAYIFREYARSLI